MTTRPIFIAGAPRSGTTFLASLLDSHQRLRMGQELWILQMRDEMHAVLARRAAIGFGDDGAERWADAVVPGLVDHITRFELERTGKARFGDKKPGYARRIPDLIRHFPDAQIIHILRDPRDVAASMLKQQEIDARWRGQPWAPTTWQAAGAQWVEFVTRARRAGAELRPDQYYELRYEQLATDPTGTATALLAFLGETLDAPSRRTLSSFKPRSKPWRDKLDDAAIAEMSAAPGLPELLDELGYEPMPQVDPTASATGLSAEVEALVGAGRGDEARALLQTAVDGGRDHPLTLSNLAVLAYHAGDTDQAASLLARAVPDDRAPAGAVVNLLAMHDHDASLAAIPALQRTWDPEVRRALGGWLIARGLDEAAAIALCDLLDATRR